MNRLTVAAAKLSERAAKRDDDRQYLMLPSARAQFVRDAQEARAVAALLRAVAEGSSPHTFVYERASDLADAILGKSTS
jgi:hypothetical protein